MLPVMIGALIAMLEGLPALGFLYRGAPIAMIVAGIWTWIRVRDRVVEICVAPEGITVLSLNDAAYPRRHPGWMRLFNVEEEDDRVVLTVGHEEFRFNPALFDRSEALLADCRAVLYPAS